MNENGANEFDSEEITVVRTSESMRAIMSNFASTMRAAQDAGIGAREAYSALLASER